jgi:hypothetical protein
MWGALSFGVFALGKQRKDTRLPGDPGISRGPSLKKEKPQPKANHQ